MTRQIRGFVAITVAALLSSHRRAYSQKIFPLSRVAMYWSWMVTLASQSMIT
jgi:hypothetical protein